MIRRTEVRALLLFGIVICFLFCDSMLEDLFYVVRT